MPRLFGTAVLGVAVNVFFVAVVFYATFRNQVASDSAAAVVDHRLQAWHKEWPEKNDQNGQQGVVAVCQFVQFLVVPMWLETVKK